MNYICKYINNTENLKIRLLYFPLNIYFKKFGETKIIAIPLRLGDEHGTFQLLIKLIKLFCMAETKIYLDLFVFFVFGISMDNHSRLSKPLNMQNRMNFTTLSELCISGIV